MKLECKYCEEVCYLFRELSDHQTINDKEIQLPPTLSITQAGK